MKTLLRCSLLRLALVAGALLLAAGSARAVEIIQPTAAASSTSGTDLFPVVNLIDGSGLSGTPTPSSLGTHADASNTTAWVTTANVPDYYAGAGALPAPVLTFTLPGPAKLVSELVIWDYAIGGTANKNEAKTFSVTFSTDGTNYGSAAVVTQPTILGSNAARLVFPGGARLATHVRVTITDNYFDGSPGGDRVGLGEVRFIRPTILTVTTADNSGAGSSGNPTVSRLVLHEQPQPPPNSLIPHSA